jgi:hypothetical protein
MSVFRRRFVVRIRGIAYRVVSHHKDRRPLGPVWVTVERVK